jgi:glyoxylase-like metal-dependent hydrolase (beta-lactamase superfamily II)
MYLLVGQNRSLLLDSGASRSAALFPLASTVQQILADHAVAAGGQPVSLLIAHTHSHGDHAAADSQFQGQPHVEVVPLGLAAVKAFYGLPQWPNGAATIDLGGRTVDVLPAPGHDPSHIVLYDRTTQLLLTGDALYPGLLVVNDWTAYAQTAERLRAFIGSHPVKWVLGAHIEMTNQPGRWFGLGALFQPAEHILQLEAQHLREWADAMHNLATDAQTDRHDDFIIFPANAPFPPLDP